MSDGNGSFRRLTVGLCLVLSWLTGCAAFHPMKGVPARFIPDELKVGHRTGKRTIDLSLLGQDWDRIHRVDGGDLLGIYISGVLGKKDENPQVLIPQNADYLPAAGVPVTVREDGTISLPLIGSLLVRGKTIRETEDAIRAAFDKSPKGKNYINSEDSRILVSLQRPRQTRVLVVRQDSRNEPQSNAAINMLNLGTTKRGTGKVVSLPAYSNDVLNALIASDGLPGLDAENAVYIIRRSQKNPAHDPVWSGAIDPAELIRQSKAEEEPVIRGQSSDLMYDRRNSAPLNFGQNGYQDDLSSNPFGGGESPFKATQTAHYPTPLSDSGPRGNLNQQQMTTQPQYQGQQGYPVQQQYPSQQSYPAQQPYASPQPYATQQPYAAPQQYPAQPQYQGQSPYQGQEPFPSQQQYSGQQLTPTPMPQYQQHQSQPAVPNGSGQPGWQSPQPSFANPQYDGNMLPTPGYSNPDMQGMDGQVPYGSHGESLEDDSQSGNGVTYSPGAKEGTQIIRIPIRLGPGEHINIKREDVILQNGDIVFIESRDTEVFFTGGLLGGGQYTLPRDFDLDILQAISIAGTRQGTTGAARAIGGVSALNSDVTISPSNIVVIRKLPDGSEIPIKVNLYEARNDLSERIIIQPGDYLYLQYTPLEAVCAFVERHLLEGALFGVLTQNMNKGN